jgi:hypothetical protein
LHTKCQNGKWEAVAVLRGLNPCSSQYSTLRGIAPLIPPRNQFTFLDAVDLFPNKVGPDDIISCHVGTRNGDRTYKVRSKAQTLGPLAVDLVGSGYDDCKCGVFVRTETPIEYCGEKDWAMMNGSMLSDPSIAEEA